MRTIGRCMSIRYGYAMYTRTAYNCVCVFCMVCMYRMYIGARDDEKTGERATRSSAAQQDEMVGFLSQLCDACVVRNDFGLLRAICSVQPKRIYSKRKYIHALVEKRPDSVAAAAAAHTQQTEAKNKDICGLEIFPHTHTIPTNRERPQTASDLLAKYPLVSRKPIHNHYKSAIHRTISSVAALIWSIWQRIASLSSSQLMDAIIRRLFSYSRERCSHTICHIVCGGRIVNIFWSLRAHTTLS